MPKRAAPAVMLVGEVLEQAKCRRIGDDGVPPGFHLRLGVKDGSEIGSIARRNDQAVNEALSSSGRASSQSITPRSAAARADPGGTRLVHTFDLEFLAALNPF